MKNLLKHVCLGAIVPQYLHGKRLDQALAVLFPNYSRTRLQTWVRQQHVLLDQRVQRPSDPVKAGETITVYPVLEPVLRWQAQAKVLDIIYEDDDLLVINKPAGWVTHPAPGHFDNTMVNAVLHHAPQLSILPRAGIVHRLDKDTSGLLVVAKTLLAHTALVRQLQARTVKRTYLAVVQGCLVAGGKIAAPIGRHPKQRHKMAVNGLGAKVAVTHYRIVERFHDYTLLRVQLETGRTHQIRVHMAHMHHPILGDRVYAPRLAVPQQASSTLLHALQQRNRQALHAQHLALCHPTTRCDIGWEAPPPDDMQQLLALLHTDNALCSNVRMA